PTAEHSALGRHPTIHDRRANPGGGNRLSFVEDIIHARRDETELGPHPAKELEVSALASAEREVLPDAKLRDGQPPREKGFDEVFRLGQREVAREWDHEQPIDPDRLDDLLLLPQ